MNKCSVTQCDKKTFCRGLCSGHYHRWQRYGSPLDPADIECLLCGETFSPKRVDTRYCSSACMDRAKVAADPEHYAKMRSAYYLANREALAAQSAAYYLANKPARKIAQRAYYEANRDSILAYQREYARVNAVKIAARNRANYFDQIAEIRNYRKANRLAIARAMAAWAKSNPEARRENEARRRARKIGNGVFEISPKDARRLQSARTCAHCAIPFTPANPKNIDHILPIARGGRHSAGNLQALCRTCNTSKNGELYSVWRHRSLTAIEARRWGDGYKAHRSPEGILV